MIRTQPKGGGWLEVVCGPMFSGKSEELIRRLRRAEIAGQRALIVKPLIDDRYDVGHVVSHAGAKMRAVNVRSSAEVTRLSAGYDAVGIDEVQFFDDGVVNAIGALVGDGARVVAAGLAQDFRDAQQRRHRAERQAAEVLREAGAAVRRGVRRQA